jgi:hypothetical protein
MRSRGHLYFVTSVSFRFDILFFRSFISSPSLATRIMIGVAVGVPLSSFCIIRRLYNISRIQDVAFTREAVCPVTEIHPQLR